MHRFRLLIPFTLFLLLATTPQPINATLVHSPTGNYQTSSVRGETLDIQPANRWYKSYNYSYNMAGRSTWPTLHWIGSRFWTVDVYGFICQYEGRAICTSPSGCTGPGSDVWVFAPAGGYEWAYISTAHTYDWEYLPPYYSAPYAGNFFTAYNSGSWANLYWYTGENRVGAVDITGCVVSINYLPGTPAP